MFINFHELCVRCFCESENVDYLPLTAMSDEQFNRWVWLDDRIDN